MADAPLVCNAGSSGLKFSVVLKGDPPGLLLRGQLGGLMTRPRFAARDVSGAAVGEPVRNPAAGATEECV